jgi:hypothetical protein
MYARGEDARAVEERELARAGNARQRESQRSVRSYAVSGSARARASADELGEDREVGVEPDAIQAPDAER